MGLVASKVAEYVNDGLPVIHPKVKAEGSRVTLADRIKSEQRGSVSAKAAFTPNLAEVGGTGPASDSTIAFRQVAQIFNGSFLILFGFFAGWMARGRNHRQDTPLRP